MGNMYYKMSEKERAMLNEISEITLTDYNLNKEMVTCDNLIVALEDLLVEYNVLKEKYDDLKNDVDENYCPKHTNDYEFYGLNKSNF